MLINRRLRGALTVSLGLALFAVMVERAGIEEITDRVGSLGASFLLVLIIGGIRPAARAAAWRGALPQGYRIPLHELFRARLIGDAVGQLTPAGPLVAEPARLAALHRTVPLTVSLHSLAVETITYLFSSGMVVLGGSLLLLASFAISQPLRRASLIASVAVLAVLALSLLVIVRRWAVLSSIGEWARRGLHLVGFSRRWKRHVRRLYAFEREVFEFYRLRQADFVSMIIYDGLFHILGVVETWLTLELLGFRTSALVAFLFEATNRAVNLVFSFVPGRVGVDEAGTGVLAQILGIGSAAGVALALVRKARVLVWTAAGLLLLTINRRRAQRETRSPGS
jgi:uncharacterized membrane protein YbhN (UPF0104 family)